MILVHELGHFLVSKWKKVRVEEFGLGYPPRVIGKRIGETIYSVNLLPMGGFVRVWGMEGRVKEDKRRSFYRQPKKVQALILIAGVVMNFLVSILVFSISYGIVGVPKKTGYIKVIEVVEGSPAEQAGIKKEEFILAIRYKEKLAALDDVDKMIKLVKEWNGEEVSFLIGGSGDLENEARWLKIVPRRETPEGEGPLGVIISDSEIAKPVLWQRIPLGAWYGIKEGFFWGVNIVGGTFSMIADLFSGRPVPGIAGPVGIYKVSSEIFKESGLLAVINFFAVVSVNLVVVNLLPLPGSDGWHISLLVFEKLRGRPVKKKIKRKINQAGMVFLLFLFFLVLFADVRRFIFK
ncbi:site-2 protease family protein [Patescibacteria group bacterium]|nr:site-2 protease family protein [Patescibacteria group bacterium]